MNYKEIIRDEVKLPVDRANRHTFGDNMEHAFCFILSDIQLVNVCHSKDKCCDN